MTLSIKTNTASLFAYQKLSKNSNRLNGSLAKLSSGLRINKAADDGSGMVIADSLKSQSNGLGQAIKNANDAISIAQTVDGALDESINIVNIIKTKAIQASQDGQTYESRKIIQEDIDKLRQELDHIAKTTSFNGQKLLSGEFTNKSFHVGAYTGETVNISVDSSESTKIGHTTVAEVIPDYTKLIYTTLQDKATGEDIIIEPFKIEYDNTPKNGIGALADQINKYEEKTDVKAFPVVESESRIIAGSTSEDFKINGITIGDLNVYPNDSDGSLMKAINSLSNETGVTANVTATGNLELISTDGRAIKVEGLPKPEVISSRALTTHGYLKMISRNFAQYDVTQGVLRDVEVTANVTTTITTLQPDPNLLPANIKYNPVNEHFYEYVSDEGVTWDSAINDTSAMNFEGLQGYLVTITSASENSFVTSQVYTDTPLNYWGPLFGASDSAVEGEWRWVTGPEAGTLFWSGGLKEDGGGPVNGEYSNWFLDSEPNNLTGDWNPSLPGKEGEHYGQLGSPDGSASYFLDIYSPRDPNWTTGYIVEYGGMPGDPEFDWTPYSNIITTEVILPETTIVEQFVLESIAYNTELLRLCDVNVTTFDDAQISMELADVSLRDLDKIRSNIGSVQNQLQSTISNITNTQVNAKASESSIRDLDISEEMGVFSKLQVLSQSGTFAMSQANTSAERLIDLLQ